MTSFRWAYDRCEMNRRQFLSGVAALPSLASTGGRTSIGIRGDQFLINGEPTYKGRTWNGNRIEGLLMNSRMVQGIFDDANPATVQRWAYPDTGKWDPLRNTREFIAAMPEWRRHGLLSFTLNLQGGSPQGYSKDQPWISSAFKPDGTLDQAYLRRLELILNRADELGMAPILGYFYFGQDERLQDDEAVRRGVEEATAWILERGWRNVLVEIANECDNRGYEQPLLRAGRIHELIDLVKSMKRSGRRLLVSASFNGGSIPAANVVRASDFVLMHGNGVSDPRRITAMVQKVREVGGYRPMPVVFNEDDHFDFEKPENNLVAAVQSYASWGFFDPEGYQIPPTNWGINTPRKQSFFHLLTTISGAVYSIPKLMPPKA
jgi:hypothetical protein